MPPELIRKGRFDEIFFVDLPTPEQRAEILTIHLHKRGLEARGGDLGPLVTASDSFSGAEIEQAVVAALYAALATAQQATAAHVLAEIRRTRPLAVLMREHIGHLRSWATGRTVPAD